MTAAATVSREADAAVAAAETMIREHREWYTAAIAEIEKRLSDLEQRERKVAKSEAVVNERRAKIERAIAGA
jgi:hypothetical protein